MGAPSGLAVVACVALTSVACSNTRFGSTDGGADEGSTYCTSPPCSAPTVFAGPPLSLLGLVWRGGYLYWSDGRTIVRRRTASADAPVETVVKAGESPFAFAVDDTSVYFTQYQPDQLYTCRLANCASPTTLFTAPDGGSAASYATWIAVDDRDVFWASRLPGALYRVGKDGSGYAVVVPNDGNELSPIALDATYVYWMNDAAEVMFAPKAGGALPARIGMNYGAVRGITVDAAGVWAVGGKPGKVGKLSPTGARTELARPGAISIAADGTYVYWVQSGDTPGGSAVYRTAESSFSETSVPQAIALGLTVDPANAPITVGDRNVYWYGSSGDAGAVFSAPK